LIQKNTVIDSVFIVQKRLGTGAQSSVYHVKTSSGNFDRALKMIEVTEGSKEKFSSVIQSVKDEFSIIKSLRHKNIIRVYDFGYDKKLDKYYYTMDYLEGYDLRKHVEHYPEISRFPDLVYQILDGLNYLHASNIIHFDIKPENIFVVDDNGNPLVKILDFGLSEIKMHNKQDQIIKGTLSYIAPEFFLDTSKISAKIDLYSLGITLIHVNKGIKGKNSSDVAGSGIIKAVNEEYKNNMDLLNEFRDKKIKSFISQLVEKDPGTRISSAVEAVISLNNIFGLNYKIPSVHQVASFLNNPKFILRDEIYRELKHEYDSAESEKEGRTVVISGASGSGKTKILKHLFFQCSLDLKKVLYVYLEDNTSVDFFIGSLLLRKIYNLYRDEIDIESEYGKINSELDDIIKKDQDITYIFDDVISFIVRCSRSGNFRIALLMDNYENYDRVSFKFVNRLIDQNRHSGDIFLTVSVATDKMDNRVAQSYKMIEYDPEIKKILLPPLSFSETEKAVELLLGKIGSLPPDFTRKVYDFTGGNFRKLMVYLDEFFSEGVLNYVSGILMFRDNEKFNMILSSKSGRSEEKLIGSLDKNGLFVLRLLCITFNKLTFDEILGAVHFGAGDLRRILKKLAEIELISGYEDLYKAIRSEVKSFVFSKSSPEELSSLYEYVAGLKHHDRFSHYASRLIRSITSKKTLYDLDAVGDFIEKMIRYDSNDNLYYLLSNSIVFAENRELRFRLEINYAYYLKNKKPEEAAKALINLDRKFESEESDIRNRISFIRLKLRMLDPDICDYDVKGFLLKAFPVMEKGMDLPDMFGELYEFIKKLLMTGRYFEHGVFITEMLERKLSGEENVPFEYPNLIHTLKFTYGVIAWKEEYEKKLSEYIGLHVENKLFSSSYFHLLRSIAVLAEKNLIKGDLGKILIDGLKEAYRSRNIDIMFRMFSTLATYNYYKGKYEESLYWDQKRVDMKQKLRIELTTDDISDIAVVKANLYYPIGEVISLIQETRRQAKERNELSLYIENITNEFVILNRKGDFRSAKTAIRKVYLYFRTLPDGETLRNYERVAKYFPEVFSKEESIADARDLLENRSVSPDVFNNMLAMLDKFYEYNICYRWSPGRTDEILDGTVHLETPMMLLHYIKVHKRLPKKDRVFKNIEPRFLNSELTGDHLAFLVTKFMMTKNEKLIDPIFEFSRKLHISGYVMLNVYTIIPFMEFALMVEVPGHKIKQFIEFYEEIRQYIYNNLDETQVGLFESTYFFRRGKKIIEYFDRK
jgi:serine/threonine protein kinase